MLELSTLVSAEGAVTASGTCCGSNAAEFAAGGTADGSSTPAEGLGS